MRQSERYVERFQGIGEVLKRFRLEAGLSFSKIAAHLGVSQVAVWKHEAGQSIPSLKMLGRYSVVHGGRFKQYLTKHYGVSWND